MEEETQKEAELTVDNTVVEEIKQSAEELKTMSDKEKMDRSVTCSNEINEILKKYNCNLAITGFSITAN